MVKWLPNSMGINPADPRCDDFYDRMKKWNMVLLCHTGQEHSIDPPGINQSLGNPLLLRRPLERGVKVIAAHCASEGEGVDLDHPEQPKESNFHLFLRLMDEPQFKDLLFADISAITAFRRLGDPLTTILDRFDLHSRLVYGSDYPVPAIKFVVQTSKLVSHQYITENERTLLNEIWEYNPLLFDYVLKRCLKSPRTGNSFPPSVFTYNKKLFGEE